MPSKDEDEFGFSSGDEADLVEFANAHLKRPREADNAGPKAKKPSFATSSSFDDDLIALAEEEEWNGKKTVQSKSSELAVRVLKERFGLEKFQLLQHAAISRLLTGESAVVVFPTGGGKSLCYQVSLA
jgi:superfamily II DNA helicase RecQ